MARPTNSGRSEEGGERPESECLKAWRLNPLRWWPTKWWLAWRWPDWIEYRLCYQRHGKLRGPDLGVDFVQIRTEDLEADVARSEGGEISRWYIRSRGFQDRALGPR